MSESHPCPKCGHLLTREDIEIITVCGSSPTWLVECGYFGCMYKGMKTSRGKRRAWYLFTHEKQITTARALRKASKR